MNFDKLTHNDAGKSVAPRSPKDWDEWVSATKLRGHLLGDTLGDWLDRYGERCGFVCNSRRRDYDRRLNLFTFVAEKGIEFEATVASYLASRGDLIRICGTHEDIRNLDTARETLAALVDGREIVHQGVLWNPETRTYGACDFLIRSDVFDRLFSDHLSPDEAKQPAPALGRQWHYLVVDTKFTKLHLGKGLKKLLAQGSSTPAYKGQLFVYNAALGRLQGYLPPHAFLLGRGYVHKYTRKKEEFTCSSDIATERLGAVPMDDRLRKKIDAAAEWIRRLRRDGGDWSPLPEPSIPELEPPSDSSGPWSEAIREIADQRRQPTRVDASRALVTPATITASQEDWREKPPLEFFVDFEDVHDLNDDFSTFPKSGGQAMIFMIGCGHLEEGDWKFRCFVAARLNAPSEARIVEDWLAHMDQTSRHFGVRDPQVFHWSNAEPTRYKAARGRHAHRAWRNCNWFDLLERVFRPANVEVRDTDGLGLKVVAKALHAHGHIPTSWGDSKVDGQGAMVGAWRCDQEAEGQKIRLADTDLMKKIRCYNEVDCRVMQEILEYVRQNH